MQQILHPQITCDHDGLDLTVGCTHTCMCIGAFRYYEGGHLGVFDLIEKGIDGMIEQERISV